MNNKDLNDFIIEIFQDLVEIESMVKILKDSALNENSESTMLDFGNALEILITKIFNTRISLEKFINESIN